MITDFAYYLFLSSSQEETAELPEKAAKTRAKTKGPVFTLEPFESRSRQLLGNLGNLGFSHSRPQSSASQRIAHDMLETDTFSMPFLPSLFAVHNSPFCHLCNPPSLPRQQPPPGRLALLLFVLSYGGCCCVLDVLNHAPPSSLLISPSFPLSFLFSSFATFSRF